MSGRIAWRPLIAGVGIVPSTTGRWATAGLFFRSGGTDWLLTALHALGDIDNTAALQVWQGPKRTAAWLIVDTPLAAIKSGPGVDAVALPLLPGVIALREWICLGPWTWPWRLPQLGERVAKFGSATGVSVGRIREVVGARVIVERLDQYPVDYEMGSSGDSGAVWMSTADQRPLALHQGQHLQTRHAQATTLDAVFRALQVDPASSR